MQQHHKTALQMLQKSSKVLYLLQQLETPSQGRRNIPYAARIFYVCSQARQMCPHLKRAVAFLEGGDVAGCGPASLIPSTRSYGFNLHLTP